MRVDFVVLSVFSLIVASVFLCVGFEVVCHVFLGVAVLFSLLSYMVDSRSSQ